MLRKDDCRLNTTLEKLREKLVEALRAVLPVVGIVMLLSFTIAPISASILLSFLMGAALIVVGIMFFTLGAEISMTPMGERVGATMAKTKNLPLLLTLAFILGFIITISEPDLQVLAEQVPSVPNMTLIMTVAAGAYVLRYSAAASSGWPLYCCFHPFLLCPPRVPGSCL